MKQLIPIQQFVLWQDTIDQMKAKRLEIAALSENVISAEYKRLALYVCTTLLDDFDIRDFIHAAKNHEDKLNGDMVSRIAVEIYEKKKLVEGQQGITVPKFAVLGKLEMSMMQRSRKGNNHVSWHTRTIQPAYRGQILNMDLLASNNLNGIYVDYYANNKIEQYNLDNS